MLVLGLRFLFRGSRSITGDGWPLPALVVLRPRAWADANDLNSDTADVVGLRRWSRFRAAACDAFHPFALLGDVMLASNLRLGVLACVARAAEPIGLNIPGDFRGRTRYRRSDSRSCPPRETMSRRRTDAAPM